MRRREFVGLLGGAAAWPLPARAQQRMPIIAYLSSRSADSDASMLVALRRGLSEGGFVEGRDLTIQYRFADGQFDRLPELIRELAHQPLAAIVFAGSSTTDAVIQEMKASQIPIVFNTGADPVALGLVTSMNRPGGNLTGVNSMVWELTGKSFGLLHELVPATATVAVLTNPITIEQPRLLEEARKAAAALRVKLLELDASSESEIETAFVTMKEQQADAAIITVNPFFLTRAKQIVALAAHHRVPAIYARREFPEAGGLMSYGFDVVESYWWMGNYAARILKGDKPADLPVVQPTRFELVINRKTARMFGIEVPPTLLAIADEVIE